MIATVETIQRAVTDPGARPALATVVDAAAYLNISRSKVYQMMDDGVLPWVKLGGSRRIRWSDLEKLVKDNLVGAGE